MGTDSVAARCPIAVMAKNLVTRGPIFTKVVVETSPKLTQFFTMLTATTVDMVDGEELRLRFAATRAATAIVHEHFHLDFKITTTSNVSTFLAHIGTAGTSRSLVCVLTQATQVSRNGKFDLLGKWLSLVTFVTNKSIHVLYYNTF